MHDTKYRLVPNLNLQPPMYVRNCKQYARSTDLSQISTYFLCLCIVHNLFSLCTLLSTDLSQISTYILRLCIVHNLFSLCMLVSTDLSQISSLFFFSQPDFAPSLVLKLLTPSLLVYYCRCHSLCFRSLCCLQLHWIAFVVIGLPCLPPLQTLQTFHLFRWMTS